MPKHLKRIKCNILRFQISRIHLCNHKSSRPNYDKTYDRATTFTVLFLFRFPYIFSSPSTASRPLLLFFHVFHYFFFPIHSTLLSNPTFTSSTHSSLSPCSFHRAVHHFEPFEFANRIYEVDRRFRIDRMASKAREIAFDHVNDAVLRCNVYSIHERLGSFV